MNIPSGPKLSEMMTRISAQLVPVTNIHAKNLFLLYLMTPLYVGEVA
jgi:hypothetical protein